MGILHEAENNGRLGIIGIEALIGGFVIVFQHNDGILALDQIQILGIKVVSFPG